MFVYSGVTSTLVERQLTYAPTPRERELTVLLGRVAQADQAALSELYDRTSHVVYGLVLYIVRDRAEAEEITLDVYMQVWRQAGRFDPERSVPSVWLCLLARSRALDRMRSRLHRDQARELPVDELESLMSAAPPPDESAAAKQEARALRLALAKIPSEQRELIELSFFRGMTHSEIATLKGLPLGTVKTRIRLGMLRLRDALQTEAI